jgi:hypothetical protein
MPRFAIKSSDHKPTFISCNILSSFFSDYKQSIALLTLNISRVSRHATFLQAQYYSAYAQCTLVKVGNSSFMRIYGVKLFKDFWGKFRNGLADL